MILDHLKEHWEHHLAAGGGSLFSLVNTGLSVGGILQALIVGYSLWVLTSVTKWLIGKLSKK